MGSPRVGCSQKSLITRNTTVGMELPQVRRDTSHTAEQRLYQRKAAVHCFYAAPSLLNAKAADGMPGRRCRLRGTDRSGLFLPWVSSWADPIRRQGERGNDPHQREEYP